MVWLIGWMRPSAVGLDRQGHVEPLAGEPRSGARRPRAALRGFIQRRLDLVLERVESGAAALRASGSSAPSPFISPVTRPLRPSDPHPDLLERVETRRRLDEAQHLVADMVETLHRSFRCYEAGFA